MNNFIFRVKPQAQYLLRNDRGSTFTRGKSYTMTVEYSRRGRALYGTGYSESQRFKFKALKFSRYYLKVLLLDGTESRC